MKDLFILVFMLFCHIVDDYYLQGWLASAKQKRWWRENAPQDKYKFDYIAALIMHSFSWSFVVHIPIMIFSNCDIWILFSILINTIIHGIVDDLKANRFKLNLIQDQIIHIIQISIVFIIFVIFN